MASWSDFTTSTPWLAKRIGDLFHQYGPGLGYLATVRSDGGPRVHPVSPVLAEGGLYCFVMDSPKRRDLERDGRYALHAYPPEHSDDEAYLTGRAEAVTDVNRIERIARASRAEPRANWRLFEFDIEVALLTLHVGPTRSPSYQVWHDPVRPLRGRRTGTGQPADDAATRCA
jgi:hypothetical protein